MDEPTSIAAHRVPAQRESRLAGAIGREASVQRMSKAAGWQPRRKASVERYLRRSQRPQRNATAEFVFHYQVERNHQVSRRIPYGARHATLVLRPREELVNTIFM